MKKSEAAVVAEVFPGLRTVVVESRRAEDAMASVYQRREAAWYAHATARAYHEALQQRAASGEAIPARELVEAKIAINEAKDAIDTFPGVIAVAERQVERALDEVSDCLRAEIRRRQADRQAELDQANDVERAATKARIAAAEALKQITGCADQLGSALREIFAAEIEAVSS